MVIMAPQGSYQAPLEGAVLGVDWDPRGSWRRGALQPCWLPQLLALQQHAHTRATLRADSEVQETRLAYQHQKKVDLSYLFLGWAEKSLYSHGYQKTRTVWVKDPTSLLAVSVCASLCEFSDHTAACC